MEIKRLHSGQYRPYGDHYDVYEIYSDSASKNEVIAFIKEEFGELPTKKEYFNLLPTKDMGYYCTGYGELSGKSPCYNYTIVHPYTG